MDKLEMMSGILNSYPYPIVFVDNEYIIRYMNKNAIYHYCEEIKRNGKEIFIGVSIRNQRIYMQGVRNDKGEWIGFFERFELNLVK